MVKIEDPHYSKMEITHIEAKQIYENYSRFPYTSNAWYSCAVGLEKWMDKMVVRIEHDIRMNKDSLTDDFENEINF